ncbi:hypothetical protein [Microbispora rosea]|uniref:hypothetical protein n=1 Tax=Microbispora rosea TaxID=58117 RepID=UPI0012DFDE44|nr:hypothetical protein [Microbispora rosea]
MTGDGTQRVENDRQLADSRAGRESPGFTAVSGIEKTAAAFSSFGIRGADLCGEIDLIRCETLGEAPGPRADEFHEMPPRDGGSPTVKDLCRLTQ